METGEANRPEVLKGGDDTIFDAYGTGMMLSDKGDLYFIGNEGFVKYDVDEKEISSLELDPRVFDINFSLGFLGQSHYHNDRSISAA